jgi:hypothetical protein
MKNKGIRMMGWMGLALLASACEKDGLLPDGGSGVPIEFSTGSMGYEAADEMRSLAARELETVVVPLGEDDLYLYATLKEDGAEEQDPSELRAQVGLTTNQKVRIAAYKGSTQQGSTLTYTYSGGQLSPDGGTPLKVEADGSTYSFVAYSYYGDPTNAAAEAGINPAKDLVWGSVSQPVTTTESTHKVNINMAHTFSQVRVKIDASTIATAITAIGTVQVLGGKTANLTARTGVVAATSTNATQNVSFPSSTSNIRTSNYCVYYRAITGVSISSITLTIGTAKTFTGLDVAFSKTLDPKKSYTLEVDMRKLAFAQSNIYWKWNDAGDHDLGGYLTFDEAANSDYQGVFFKWGSLVGISPVGSGSPNMPNVALYIPNVSAGTWDGTKTIGTSDWGNYTSIPLITLTGTTNRYGNALYDNPDFDSYKGDICAYLTGKTGVPAGSWRMPNAAEFGLIPNYSAWIAGSNSNLNAEGMGIVGAGRKYFSILFFPASGYRTTAGVAGTLLSPGGFGRYWSGSLDQTDSQGYVTNLTESDAASNTSIPANPNEAHPVRCIKI